MLVAMEQWQSRPNPGPGRGTGLRWLRLIIIAVTLVLGLVLLSRGSLVIGGLVTALAVLRIVMVIGMERRRRAFRARFTRPGGSG